MNTRRSRMLILRYLPLIVILASIANVYLAISSYRASVPREIFTYHEFTNVVEVVVTTNLVSFLTNDVHGSVSSVPGAPSSQPSCVCRVPYQYFINGPLIGAHIWGRFFYDGSPCSYGRIESIYPDRILLADGNWIENARSFDLYDEKKARFGYDSRTD